MFDNPHDVSFIKEREIMVQKRQRGWLKKEKRTQGETWVLFFRITRTPDRKRVEHKVPIGLVHDLPDERSAWAEVARLHLPINQVDHRRGLTFADLAPLCRS